MKPATIKVGCQLNSFVGFSFMTNDYKAKVEIIHMQIILYRKKWHHITCQAYPPRYMKTQNRTRTKEATRNILVRTIENAIPIFAPILTPSLFLKLNQISLIRLLTEWLVIIRFQLWSTHKKRVLETNNKT